MVAKELKVSGEMSSDAGGCGVGRLHSRSGLGPSQESGMTTRKGFISSLAAASATAALGVPKASKNMIWAMYMQIGSNMWKEPKPLDENGRFCGERCWTDDVAWDNRVAYARKNGINMMLVEIAEAMRYPSHPEIALTGKNADQSSRSPEWMNERVRKCREMGIEVIPQLNFSATHDAWLGFYSRMVSSPTYYRVAGDLIRDVNDIFEKPRFIGMGMDEEAPDFARNAPLGVARTGELLWHDINFFGNEISKLGARPWMWSDLEWWYPPDFAKHVSKDILQTNWYYGQSFDSKAYKAKNDMRWKYIESYNRLDAAGFDQVPGPSNWLEGRDKREGKTENRVNTDMTLEYCKRCIDPKRLLGYVSLPWCGSMRNGDKTWFDACDQLVAARAKHYPNG